MGKYPGGASPYGAVDMAGNVWEWVADWYADHGTGATRNPTGPSSGQLKVLRGGAFDNVQASVRTSSRFVVKPDFVHYVAGFRCSK